MVAIVKTQRSKTKSELAGLLAHQAMRQVMRTNLVRSCHNIAATRACRAEQTTRNNKKEKRETRKKKGIEKEKKKKKE